MQKKKLTIILLLAIQTSFFAQSGNVGIKTPSPGTALDVNGAITNRETAITVSGNAATVPSNVSQVQLTGTATAAVAITAPAAPNSGQRLVIFNNTAGGFGATLNGITIPNGKALEYIYSNSGWRATDGGSIGAIPVNIYTANGTLTSNRTVSQGANTLAFTGTQTNAFSVDGNSFSVDASNHVVGIGTNLPYFNTKLTINSAGNTYGFVHTNGIVQMGSLISNSGFAQLGTATAHDFSLMANNNRQITIATGTGYVGINTTTPLSPLHLSATGSVSGVSNSFLTPGMLITGPTSSSGFTGPGIYFEGLNNPSGQRVMKLNMTNNGTAGYLNFQAVTDNASTTVGFGSVMSIHSSGNVGIDTNTPTSTLSVNGSADKTGGGLWGTFSDERMKKNVTPYHQGLKQIIDIKPVTFQYNGKGGYKDDGKTYVGVLAQEIEKVLPGTVTKIKTADFEDQRKYNPSEIIYTLINAVKEQQKMIEEQAAQIKSLQTDVHNLKHSDGKASMKSN